MEPQRKYSVDPPLLHLPQDTELPRTCIVQNEEHNELVWEDKRPLKKRRGGYFQYSPSTSSGASRRLMNTYEVGTATTIPGHDGSTMGNENYCVTDSILPLQASTATSTLPSVAPPPEEYLEIDLEALTYYPPASTYLHESQAADISAGRFHRRFRRRRVQMKQVRFYDNWLLGTVFWIWTFYLIRPLLASLQFCTFFLVVRNMFGDLIIAVLLYL